MEEFLYDLVTDYSLLCFDCSPYEFDRAVSLLRSILVKRVDEDIRVEEKPIAHSSHPE